MTYDPLMAEADRQALRLIAMPTKEVGEITPLYRHSLFFLTKEVAEAADAWVRRNVKKWDHSFIDEDTNEMTIYECRFFTIGKLAEIDQDWVCGKTFPVTYAFNCED